MSLLARNVTRLDRKQEDYPPPKKNIIKKHDRDVIPHVLVWGQLEELNHNLPDHTSEVSTTCRLARIRNHFRQHFSLDLLRKI